ANVGLGQNAADQSEIDTISARTRGSSKPTYFPGGTEMTLKLIFNKRNRCLIGGQMIGEEDTAQRINLISTAIQKKMTIDEVLAIETCYSPPITPTWDIITITAEAALRKFEKIES
ncbi:MAG: NADH oxidase, partial [Candidatus Hodarchaeota archaeon]